MLRPLVLRKNGCYGSAAPAQMACGGARTSEGSAALARTACGGARRVDTYVCSGCMTCAPVPTRSAGTRI